MSLKYAILCFLLFLAVLFLAERSYHALTQPLQLVSDKGGSKREAKPGNPPAIKVPKAPVNIASNNIIAGKNIFNPERKDFAALGSGMSAKPVVRPQVILYGVTIAGDYRSASVVSPGRPLKKGEREQVTVKVGERIGEYRLASVLSDRIKMEAGEDTFEVLLYDPKAPKKRVETRTEVKPATIAGAQTPPIPTSEARGGSGPSNLGTPNSMPVTNPVVPIPKGTFGETTGPQQQPSVQPSAQSPPAATPPGTATPPSATTPPPGSAPSLTQLPSVMTPAPLTPPFAPTSLPVPSDLARPTPLPPGGQTPGGR